MLKLKGIGLMLFTVAVVLVDDVHTKIDIMMMYVLWEWCLS